MAVDWMRIKTEYINGSISLRKLAKKSGVSYSQLAKIAAAEKWNDQKESQRINIESKTNQKAAEKISDIESEVIAIKSRLKLSIYQQIEKRMENVDEMEGFEFRRIVQNYKDMCDIKDVDTQFEEDDGVTIVIDV